MTEGCQTEAGVWESELCGVETVPGSKYCLEHSVYRLLHFDHPELHGSDG